MPTGNYREHTVDIIPVTNYYVDKSSLDEALAGLKKAEVEAEIDNAQPVIYLDMPEEDGKDEEDDVIPDGSGGAFRRVFCGMEPSARFNVLIIGLVAGFAVLGLFLALISLG